MSLLELWKQNPNEFINKRVQQLISFCGQGRLLDGNAASIEFRDFLANIEAEYLKKYAQDCLTEPFDDRGFALQDIVNQVGLRLGFEVTDGKYRGSKGTQAYDGIWVAPEGNAIIVEVKTTDAYRIDLNTVASYRRTLIMNREVNEEQSSILIVVGRKDTPDLEAQIRGSKHAWDIRLISVDALIRLLDLKQMAESPHVETRIRKILIPREYTRVDDIIDLLFSATEDIKHYEDEVISEIADEGEHEQPLSQSDFYQGCIQRIEQTLQQSLMKRSRVLYATANNAYGLVCLISRKYKKVDGNMHYWFAFHSPHIDTFTGFTYAYVALGLGSPKKILLFPFSEFKNLLPSLNRTSRDDACYWHVHIWEIEQILELRLKGDQEHIIVNDYLLENFNQKIISQEKTQPELPYLEMNNGQGYELYTNLKIIGIRFKNKEYPIRRWKEAITTICSVVLAEYHDQIGKVFELKGTKRAHFAVSPVGMREPRSIPGTDLFVETHLSAKECVKFIHRFLKTFDYQPQDVVFIVEQPHNIITAEESPSPQ